MDERLYCKDCKILVYPQPQREFIGEREHGGWMEFAPTCPNCGGDDLTDWQECSNCRAIMPDNGEEICDKCKQEIRDKINEFFDMMLTDYNDTWIKDAFQELLEGV